MDQAEKEQLLHQLQNQIKDKILERGEAMTQGDGWHDNAVVDSINTDIAVLESRIRSLNI